MKKQRILRALPLLLILLGSIIPAPHADAAIPPPPGLCQNEYSEVCVESVEITGVQTSYGSYVPLSEAREANGKLDLCEPGRDLGGFVGPYGDWLYIPASGTSRAVQISASYENRHTEESMTVLKADDDLWLFSASVHIWEFGCLGSAIFNALNSPDAGNWFDHHKHEAQLLGP